MWGRGVGEVHHKENYFVGTFLRLVEGEAQEEDGEGLILGGLSPGPPLPPILVTRNRFHLDRG